MADPQLAIEITPNKRARELLRNYYGIKPTSSIPGTPRDILGTPIATPTTAAHTPAPQKQKVDVLDIDGSHFDARRYADKIITINKVSDVLKSESQLRKEIHQLDGDRKTFVYENYNKFLTAADAIQTMKTDISNMDKTMQKLKEGLNKMTSKTVQLDSVMKGRRDKINKLTSTHCLLRKLQFVIELPTRLTQCLEHGMYAQAVQYYTKTSRLLKQYHRLTVFQGIETESQEIMKKIEKNIRTKMKHHQSSVKEIADNLGLILALGKQTPEDLWKDYLSLQSKALLRVKSETIRKMADGPMYSNESLQSIGGSSDISNKPSGAQYVKTFLKQLNLCADYYYSYFLTENEPPLEGVPENLELPTTETGTKLIQDTYKLKLTQEQLIAAKKDLIQTIKPMEDEFFNLYESRLVFPDDPSQYNPKRSWDILSGLQGEILRSSTLVTIGWQARVATLIKTHYQNMVDKSFQSLASSVSGQIKAVVEDKSLYKQNVILSLSPDVNIRKRFEDVMEYLRSQFLVILERIESFLNSELSTSDSKANIRKDFISYVQGALQSVWCHMLDQLLILAQLAGKRMSLLHPCTALICCIFTMDLESSHIIQNTFQQFMEKLSTYDEGSTDKWMLDLVDSVAICKEKAQYLMYSYSVTCTNFLLQFVHEYNPNVQEQTVNKSISKNWRTVTTELGALSKTIGVYFMEKSSSNELGVEKEEGSDTRSSTGSGKYRYQSPVQYAVPSSTRKRSTSNGSSQGIFPYSIHTGSQGSTPNHHNVLRTINKLFAERLDFYVLPTYKDLNVASIMDSIIRIFLKGFIEALRLKTLNGSVALQQVQIDVEFLRVQMWKFILDEKIFNTLLDEIMLTASKRCSGGGTLLEIKTLESILQAETGLQITLGGRKGTASTVKPTSPTREGASSDKGVQ